MLAAVLDLHLTKECLPMADDMKKNIYVDNILSGYNSEEEIVQYYSQARAIMGSWSQHQANVGTFTIRTTIS